MHDSVLYRKSLLRLECWWNTHSLSAKPVLFNIPKAVIHCFILLRNMLFVLKQQLYCCTYKLTQYITHNTRPFCIHFLYMRQNRTKLFLEQMFHWIYRRFPLRRMLFCHPAQLSGIFRVHSEMNFIVPFINLSCIYLINIFFNELKWQRLY